MKILVLLVSSQLVLCRDYYKGIFRKDDYLVAQDNVFKARRPYSFTQAEYGRIFKCPITYFRVVDRLGIGPGPIVKIIRGGLLKKYIVARIKSGYNLPVSVNVYVGCENKEPRKPTIPWRTTAADIDDTTGGDGNATGDGNSIADGNATPAIGGGAEGSGGATAAGEEAQEGEAEGEEGAEEPAAEEEAPPE